MDTSSFLNRPHASTIVIATNTTTTTTELLCLGGQRYQETQARIEHAQFAIGYNIRNRSRGAWTKDNVSYDFCVSHHQCIIFPKCLSAS